MTTKHGIPNGRTQVVGTVATEARIGRGSAFTVLEVDGTKERLALLAFARNPLALAAIHKAEVGTRYTAYGHEEFNRSKGAFEFVVERLIPFGAEEEEVSVAEITQPSHHGGDPVDTDDLPRDSAGWKVYPKREIDNVPTW